MSTDRMTEDNNEKIIPTYLAFYLELDKVVIGPIGNLSGYRLTSWIVSDQTKRIGRLI